MVLMSFFVMVVRTLSMRAAYRLNELTKPEFRSKGLAYYADAVGSIALSIMFGSCPRKIIRLSSWQKDKPVHYSRDRKNSRNAKIHEKENVKRNTILINGQFRCVVTPLLMDFIENETNEWFVISEHRFAEGCYAIGRRVRSGSVLTHMAIGMARSSFVRLEVGPETRRECSLITEDRASLRSRDISRDFDPIECARVFASNLGDQKMGKILLVEMDRPPEEKNSYEFYKAQTGDAPHTQSYFNKLALGKLLMANHVDEMSLTTHSKRIMTDTFRKSTDNGLRFTGLFYGDSVELPQHPMARVLETPYCVDGSKWAVMQDGNWYFERSGKYNPADHVRHIYAEYADCI